MIQNGIKGIRKINDILLNINRRIDPIKANPKTNINPPIMKLTIILNIKLAIFIISLMILELFIYSITFNLPLMDYSPQPSF